jgi:hypothetical protein
MAGDYDPADGSVWGLAIGPGRLGGGLVGGEGESTDNAEKVDQQDASIRKARETG